MINITDSVARRRWVAEMDRQMTILEAGYIRRLTPLLNRQFKDAADFVSHGMIDSSDQAVDARMKDQVTLLMEHYKRVATVFSNKAYKIIEKSKFVSVPEIKAPLNEFWREIDTWASTQAAQKIRKIQKTTKSNIAKIIQVGMKEGESHRDIAKRITKTSTTINPYRARTIALTETHTAAVKSIDSAVKSTRIEMEREWVAAKDIRTRRRGKGMPFDHWVADGERTSQDGKFTLTGEALEYPGDPKGSAGNIILCRCVLLYHAVRIVELSKPYVPSEDVFIPANTLEETENRFKNVSFNNIIKADEKLSEQEWIKTYVNPMLNQAEDLKRQFPKVFDLMEEAKTPVEKLYIYQDVLADDVMVKGRYLIDEKGIKVASSTLDKMVGERLDLGKGAFSVSHDSKTTLRHELGHHLQESVLAKDDFKDKVWRTISARENVYDFFEKNVSKYASTNTAEAFAESFAAYTSPKYKMGMLPKEIEGYFENLIGKRKLPGMVKPKLEGVLGRLSIGSPVKSADEILKHFKDSSKATFIEGKSPEDLKKAIEERLSGKMLALKSPEMDEFVRFMSGVPAPDMAEYYSRATENIIRGWAATSGDSNPKSIMMQLAAKAEFKLEGTTIWWKTEVLKEAEELFKIHEKAARQFIRMMYEDTQEHLKKLGLKTVRIARGHKGKIGDILSTIEKPLLKTKIQLQPMSSFSGDINEARVFTGGADIKNMFFAEVPAERILSTPVTGFGCMDEVEFVVLAAKEKVGETVFVAAIKEEQFSRNFWELFEVKITEGRTQLSVQVSKKLYEALK